MVHAVCLLLEALAARSTQYLYSLGNTGKTQSQTKCDRHRQEQSAVSRTYPSRLKGNEATRGSVQMFLSAAISCYFNSHKKYIYLNLALFFFYFEFIDVVDTFTTHASLVCDVTITNWSQNGSAHGRHLAILINVDFNHTTTTTTTTNNNNNQQS